MMAKETAHPCSSPTWLVAGMVSIVWYVLHGKVCATLPELRAKNGLWTEPLPSPVDQRALYCEVRQNPAFNNMISQLPTAIVPRATIPLDSHGRSESRPCWVLWLKKYLVTPYTDH